MEDNENEQEIAALRAHNEKQGRELEEMARRGERLNDWVKAGHFLIIDEILKDQEQAALNTLKNPSFDIENKTQLYQFRALLIAADFIRGTIDQKIDAGIAARAQILQNSTPKESE